MVVSAVAANHLHEQIESIGRQHALVRIHHGASDLVVREAELRQRDREVVPPPLVEERQRSRFEHPADRADFGADALGLGEHFDRLCFGEVKADGGGELRARRPRHLLHARVEICEEGRRPPRVAELRPKELPTLDFRLRLRRRRRLWVLLRCLRRVGGGRAVLRSVLL